MMTCLLCQAPSGEPIYRSGSSQSLTSVCKPISVETKVYFCRQCAHIQTAPIAGVEQYYDQEYKILADSEEEDQIYSVRNDTKVFRTDHQIDILIRKVKLDAKTKILDYGSAKGSTLKKLVERTPGLVPHLFDVSQDYVKYWEKFADPNNWSCYKTRPEWQNHFDVVTAFFVIEHVTDPISSLIAMRDLLRIGGTIYFIVPNVFFNTADLLVAEHVNHFTPASLRYALITAGFESINIDETAHEGAYVASAIRSQPPEDAAFPSAQEIESAKERSDEIAKFYTDLAARIRKFEQNYNGTKAAIYGAGFYGSFIAMSLADISNISCFIDQNPHLSNRQHFGKPVVTPAEVDPDVTTIYVGLNPNTATGIIQNIAAFRNRDLNYFLL